VTLVMWNLILIHLEIVLVLVQDRCMVWPNVAQKSFWIHPTVPLGDEVKEDTCMGPFGDSANLDAR
jgi:hypothetical protein